MKMKWCGIIVILLVFYSTTALAQRMSVSSSVANIRSGPDTGKYDILWKAEKYYPIDVIKKKEGWFYFKDFEGDKGWIHKSLVSNTPSVITRREKCNIRSKPSTKSGAEVLFTVEAGVPFKVLETKDGWIKIQHADGDKGWVHKSLVW